MAEIIRATASVLIEPIIDMLIPLTSGEFHPS
jgi:hypothetical protein